MHQNTALVVSIPVVSAALIHHSGTTNAANKWHLVCATLVQFALITLQTFAVCKQWLFTARFLNFQLMFPMCSAQCFTFFETRSMRVLSLLSSTLVPIIGRFVQVNSPYFATCHIQIHFWEFRHIISQMLRIIPSPPAVNGTALWKP